MILATFSKVIEELRNAPATGIYDIKNEVIEALAGPLAEIIRIRLGTDRQWRSVLRELTFIAVRFNQKYPKPKFDLDILQLVGPAVVAHFNKDVDPREVLSAVTSCYEECELEEFESLLDRTPEVLKIDQEADIDWEVIIYPLTVIADAVEEQRDQWSQGMLKLPEHYLPVSTTNSTPSPDAGLYPVGAMTQQPSGPPQVTGFKTFDIAVSPELPTQIETLGHSHPSEEWNPLSDVPLIKSKLRPFIPIIIGVVVILLFIVGTTIVSGNWNPLGNTTNATGASKTVTATKTTATPTQTATAAQPTATPTTTATTTKTTSTPAPSPQQYSSSDIGNHLVEIAFGPNNNVITKPKKDFLEITYSGKYQNDDTALLYNFINQFNNYSATTKISTNVNFNSPADIWIDFLPENALKQVQLTATASVSKDFQTGKYYFIYNGEKTHVNADLDDNELKRWILRAILYNMGFYGETAKYPDSLFYAGTNKATQMSDIDLRALQLMYGRKITNGMSKSTVKSTLGL
jgi:cell division septation protein DedD